MMKSPFYKVLAVLSFAAAFVVLPSYYLLQSRFDQPMWRLNLTRGMGFMFGSSRKNDVVVPGTAQLPIATDIHQRARVVYQGVSSKKETLHGSSPVNVVKGEKKRHNYVKGVLRFGNKRVEIFLHGSHDMISNIILQNGMWETHWIDQMIKYLKANPGMQLIDAGCNLGVYTLVAASLGHNVIAIDANKNNTDRLAQSVLLNHLTDRVTIMLNALSNERRTFSMNRVDDNVGGQELTETFNNSYRVKSIFLDDLLPHLDRKKGVMMKMDIQYHEIRAMKAAWNLFNKTQIKLILIEWVGLKDMAESYTVMEFLLSRNYSAYNHFFSRQTLDVSQYKKWPYDVVWRRG